MEIHLRRNKEEVLEKLKRLRSREDVADILEISDAFLRAILYFTKERRKYYTFEIHKKSNKKRIVSAPPKNLSIIQKKLYLILNYLYEPKKCVYGFVKKKNIVYNAKCHLYQRHILNIDLENFFPSIYLGRIVGLLKKGPFNFGNEAAMVIAQIVTLDNGQLPQGASTSPILANLVCRTMDSQLLSLSRQSQCNYTRYADDITFSSRNKKIPERIALIENDKIYLSDELRKIIVDNSFKINEAKVRYSSRRKRQEVTGLTVNEFPNLKRDYIKRILKDLYIWKRYGYVTANNYCMNKNKTKVELKNNLRGRLSYFKMVRGGGDPLFRKLAYQYNRLSENKINISPLESITPTPLRGIERNSEEGLQHWFNVYRDSVIFIEIHKDGETFGATGFYIGNGIVATAGHNIKDNKINIYLNDTQIECENRYIDEQYDVGILRVECFKNKTYFPSQIRLPEVGENVAAIGFPKIPYRNKEIVFHKGHIESFPPSYDKTKRFIQVNFQSGGGLSGAPLIDRRGYVLGIMIENVFEQTQGSVPAKSYGQAIPIEYLTKILYENGYL